MERKWGIDSYEGNTNHQDVVFYQQFLNIGVDDSEFLLLIIVSR